MRLRSARLASVLVTGLLCAEHSLAQCPPGPPPPPPPPTKGPPTGGGGVGGAGPTTPGPAGGTYGGPGDTTPGPAGPGTPGGGGASTPGPSGPGTPGGGPATSPRGGPAMPTPGAGGPTSPSTPSASLDSFSGPNAWELWWRFNQYAFLDLREAVWSGVQVTGDDEFFLGEGSDGAMPVSLRPTRAQLVEGVAPALRRLIASESQPGTLAAALMGLAQLGDLPESSELEPGEGARELIRRHVPHSNRHVGETAVLALGVQGAPASIFDLAGLLRDDELGRELSGEEHVPARLRSFAAFSLGLVASENPANPDVQRFCAHALVQALEHDDSASPDLAVACVTALGMTRLPDGAATPEHPAASRQALCAYLIERLQSSRLRDHERAHVPRALARQVEPLEEEGEGEGLRGEVARALLRTLEAGRTDRRVRAGCVLALGVIGNAGDGELDELVRRRLIGLMREGDRTVRGFSLIALGQIGGRPGSGDGAMKGIPEIVEHMLVTMARGKSDVRPWAALALGVQGHAMRAAGRALSEDVDAALRTQLEECSSSAELGAYAIALGLRGDNRSGPLLLEELERLHDDAPLGHCAQALGLMDYRHAIEPLRELLDEATFRPELARPLAMGLALLEHEELVPEILAELRASEQSYLRGLLTWTLTYIGDARALSDVVACMEDQDQPPHNRSIAAYAAGAIGDQARLPWNVPVALDVNYSATTATLYAEDGEGILDVR